MINQVKNSYPHCDNLGCHTRINDSFYCKDDAPNKCIIVADSNIATSYIENKNKLNIDFLCIDTCLINSASTKKCDLVLISDTAIWFIELKEVIFNGKDLPTTKDFYLTYDDGLLTGEVCVVRKKRWWQFWK